MPARSVRSRVAAGAGNLPGATLIRRLLRVSDPHGLHARPAALIARAAKQFEAEIILQRGDAAASGKSLIELMTLCAGPGELVTIVAEGADAGQSMLVLEDLFQRHAFMTSA